VKKSLARLRKYAYIPVMKSKVVEIRGCSGSFRYHTLAEYETMRDAKAHANRLTQDRIDRMGVSRRAYFADRSNTEGSFHALRMDETAQTV
jgi:hypothetical protein